MTLMYVSMCPWHRLLFGLNDSVTVIGCTRLCFAWEEM